MFRLEEFKIRQLAIPFVNSESESDNRLSNGDYYDIRILWNIPVV